MNNKHNPYLRLFTRDIEGSPKINALSMQASGLYFRLLNRFNEPPMPGSLALHEWEVHHTWARSLTQQCLRCTDNKGRLLYFAKYLSKIFQWSSADILKALQELYFFGIIVVEGDRLIQPRMYKDNGYKLQGVVADDAEIDPATGAISSPADSDEKSVYIEETDDKENKEKKIASKNNPKTTQKKTSKNTATHARVHALSNESESNNIVDKDINKRTTKKSAVPKKQPVSENPPTLEDIQAYFDERQQQGKPFLYVTPDSFYDACEQSGWRLKDGKPMMDWRARVRTFENYRRERGDPPVGQRKPKDTAGPIAASPPKEGKYTKW